MAKVEYCDKCGFIKQQCECPDPKTNADRIRAMSDEELVCVIECPYDTDRYACGKRTDCYSCTLKWLQEKV